MEDSCKINGSQTSAWKITIPKGASIKIKDKRSPIDKITNFLKSTFDKICKVCLQDTRRIYHSIKVGFALVIVSLFYFMNPLFHGLGGMTIWSVMTVVVVLEFTVGATLGKGVNRMGATLLGGLLATFTNFIADSMGDSVEPYLLGFGVFLIGGSVTFVRFFPRMKKRYDYGMVIFLLTYSFMTISGFREDKLFKEALLRIITIVIGCVLCCIISIVLFPIWAGDDLHALIINHMNSLSSSIRGCIEIYFDDQDICEEAVDKITMGYKGVLNSKSIEESMANFARWEPCHGRFKMTHPWQDYLKVGALLRSCAYSVEALNGCINSQIQVPFSEKENIRNHSIKLAMECSKVLEEVAESTKSMRKSSLKEKTQAMKESVNELHMHLVSQQPLIFTQLNKIKSEEATTTHKGKEDKEVVILCENEYISLVKVKTRNLIDKLQVGSVAFLLTEIALRIDQIVTEVEHLSIRANFSKIDR